MARLWSILLLIGLGLSVLVLVVAALVPADPASLAPSAGTGERQFGAQWCEAMMELPNPQWQEEQTLAFAKNCLTD